MNTFRFALAGVLCVGLGAPAAARNPSPVPDPTRPGSTEIMPPNTPVSAPGTPSDEPLRAPPVRAQTEPAARGDLSTANLAQARQVLSEVRQVNALEIAAGKLAEERASSEQVKGFGKLLVEDHQAADRKVVDLASRYKVELSGLPTRTPVGTKPAQEAGTPSDTGPVALNAQSRATVGKLHGLRGAAFDREFTRTMVEGHEKALDLLKGAKSKIDNADFRAVFGDLETSVTKHLDHAKRLQADVGPRAGTDPLRTREGRPEPAATP